MEQEGHTKKTILLSVGVVVLILAVVLIVAVNVGKTSLTDAFGSDDAESVSIVGNDFIRELQQQGIDNIVLPSELMKFSYSDIDIQDAEYVFGVRIKMLDPQSKIRGNIVIFRYDEVLSDIAGKGNNPNTDYKVEQFSVNGFDVLLFYNDKSFDIEYLDGLTEYGIYLDNCDYETAVSIIMSLPEK